jgi:hypothetical protein
VTGHRSQAAQMKSTTKVRCPIVLNQKAVCRPQNKVHHFKS